MASQASSSLKSSRCGWLTASLPDAPQQPVHEAGGLGGERPGQVDARRDRGVGGDRRGEQQLVDADAGGGQGRRDDALDFLAGGVGDDPVDPREVADDAVGDLGGEALVARIETGRLVVPGAALAAVPEQGVDQAGGVLSCGYR